MKMTMRSCAGNMKKRKQHRKAGRNRLPCKPRLSTLMRDKEILKRLRQGKAPKEVAHEMGLTSVWVVYDAVRRFKVAQRNSLKD